METLNRTARRNLSWHTLGAVVLILLAATSGRLTWSVLAGIILYQIGRWALHVPHDRAWFWYWRHTPNEEE